MHLQKQSIITIFNSYYDIRYFYISTGFLVVIPLTSYLGYRQYITAKRYKKLINQEANLGQKLPDPTFESFRRSVARKFDNVISRKSSAFAKVFNVERKDKSRKMSAAVPKLGKSTPLFGVSRLGKLADKFVSKSVQRYMRALWDDAVDTFGLEEVYIYMVAVFVISAGSMLWSDRTFFLFL